MNIENLKQEVIEYIDHNKDELFNLCSSLIKINSENPPGDSTEITEFIEKFLHENKFETERYESADKLYNIISSIGEGDGKTLIYCGHSDVVPAGDYNKWDFHPFSGEVKDGWLLGRGASDMKSGLGGMLFAATVFNKLNIKLPGKLTLAIVPDEETGGEYGVPWILENNLIDGDGCLIPEPSSPLNPTVGQKGSYWFKLTTYGTPGHGSLSPLAGGNAIIDAIKAIHEINSLWDIEIKMPDEVQELLSATYNYMNLVETERKEFYPVIEHISVNIGSIKAGTKANVIPERCEVEVDCRLPFGITQEEVTAILTEKLDGLNIDYEIERFGFKSNANFTDPNDPICSSVVNSIKIIKNENAYGVMQWASSDARHFREYNIPVLQYGPAYLPSIHGYNEKVKIDDILDCCKVYALTVIDFLYK